jgi:hypothetical protein
LHVPHESIPPQPSLATPQVSFCDAHVDFAQPSLKPPSVVPVDAAHWFGVPPAPHASPVLQLPHEMMPPHFVSVTVPQLAWSSLHVGFTHPVPFASMPPSLMPLPSW